MNYYLRTLEGLGRCLAGLDDIQKNFLNNSLKRNFEETNDLQKAVYNTIKNAVYYQDYNLDDIVSWLLEGYKDSIQEPLIKEAIRLYKVYESRQRQQAQAQEQASEQAAAERSAKEVEPMTATITDSVEYSTDNEVITMNDENIEVGPVVVPSAHEYTYLWEDEKSITYQDETGEIHTEPKAENSAAPWLIAVAAALLFLV